jgi:hypothetical protein
MSFEGLFMSLTILYYYFVPVCPKSYKEILWVLLSFTYDYSFTPCICKESNFFERPFGYFTPFLLPSSPTQASESISHFSYFCGTFLFL